MHHTLTKLLVVAATFNMAIGAPVAESSSRSLLAREAVRRAVTDNLLVPNAKAKAEELAVGAYKDEETSKSLWWDPKDVDDDPRKAQGPPDVDGKPEKSDGPKRAFPCQWSGRWTCI
jgi:hypothetical protein